MRRRDFVTLIGGVASWPLAARAQQATKLPTIGFLVTASASAWGPWTAAFVQRLRELGWIGLGSRAALPGARQLVPQLIQERTKYCAAANHR